MNQNPTSGRDGKNEGISNKDYWEHITISKTWDGGIFDWMGNPDFYRASSTGMDAHLLRKPEELQSGMRYYRDRPEPLWLFQNLDVEAKLSVEPSVRFANENEPLQSSDAFQGVSGPDKTPSAISIEEVQSQVLANISHEMKNPLNSILLLSQVLATNGDGNLTKEQQQYASVIKSSGKNLLRLLDDMLDFRQMEMGKLSLRLRNASVSQLCQSLESAFQPIAKLKNITFSVAVETDHTMIHTDNQRLEQILNNLLSNAIKFTRSGEVKLRVYSPTTDNSGAIAFEIIDTGPGISTADQELVFLPFERGTDPSRKMHPGTGLGLTISRNIAKFLGGTIELKSIVGTGSTFTLSMPIHSSHATSAIKPIEMQRDKMLNAS